MSNGRIIRGSDAPRAQSWQVPDVGINSVSPEQLAREEAERQAREAQERKRQELEGIRQKAYDDGFAEGRAAGWAEGEEAVKQREQALSEAVATFEAATQLLAEPLSQVDEQVEEELLQLVRVLMGQLFHREIKLVPEEITAVIREALQALPMASNQVRIHLHPEDVAIVREHLSQQDGDLRWQLIEEPSLSRGGGRVEAGNSSIDASLEARLQNCIQEILGATPQPDSPPPSSQES